VFVQRSTYCSFNIVRLKKCEKHLQIKFYSFLHIGPWLLNIEMFCSPFLGTYNVTKIIGVGSKMNKIWLMEVRGVNVRFKHTKK